MMVDICEYEIWLNEPLYSEDGKKIIREIKMPWCEILDKDTLSEMYDFTPKTPLTECPYTSKYCSVRDLIDRSDVFRSIFTDKFILENVKK